MSSSPAGTIAELLLRRAEARSTGIVTLTRGQVRKQLFLRDGDLVSAESNLREEALGELLVTLGVLPRSRLNQLLAEVKRRGQRMGTVLLELHWATADDVLSALREQVRRRAQSCLRWNVSEASFEPSTDFVGNIIEHRFELAPLIFGGLREVANLDLLTPGLDQTPEAVVRLQPGYARWNRDFEAVFGGELPTLLAGPSAPPLGGLVLRPDAGALLYALEALLATGLIALEDPTVARPVPAGSLPTTGYESGSFAVPSVADPHSGFVGPPSAISDWRQAGSGEAEPGQFPGYLALEYLQMHGKSPHAVLGVPENASRVQIDEAYARRLATIDEAAAGTSLHPKLAEMIESYARAHLALTSGPAAIAEAAVAAHAGAQRSSDPLDAELAFSEGRALAAAGRTLEAVAAFRRAVDRRPDQAAYHAWLGWTLYAAQGRAALPEARDRMEHAVAVDPDSVDGHALLGRLLVTLGDPGAARAHLERTLALQTEQPEIVDLLARVYLDAGQPAQAERLRRRFARS